MSRRAIFASAALVVALPACQTPIGGAATQPIAQAAPGDGADWYYKAGLYAGYAEVENESSTTLRGGTGGGRAEIGAVLTENFEFGGRVSVGLTQVDQQNAVAPGSSIDFSTIDVYIEPVFRAYVGSSNTRPYAEVFAGFAYTDIDQDTFVPPVLTVVHDEGLGFTYGGGLGVEFTFDNEVSGPMTMSIGAELRQTDYDTDDLGDLDQLSVLGTILFGTRW